MDNVKIQLDAGNWDRVSRWNGAEAPAEGVFAAIFSSSQQETAQVNPRTQTSQNSQRKEDRIKALEDRSAKAAPDKDSPEPDTKVEDTPPAESAAPAETDIGHEEQPTGTEESPDASNPSTESDTDTTPSTEPTVVIVQSAQATPIVAPAPESATTTALDPAAAQTSAKPASTPEPDSMLVMLADQSNAKQVQQQIALETNQTDLTPDALAASNVLDTVTGSPAETPNAQPLTTLDSPTQNANSNPALIAQQTAQPETAAPTDLNLQFADPQSTPQDNAQNQSAAQDNPRPADTGRPDIPVSQTNTPRDETKPIAQAPAPEQAESSRFTDPRVTVEVAQADPLVAEQKPAVINTQLPNADTQGSTQIDLSSIGDIQPANTERTIDLPKTFATPQPELRPQVAQPEENVNRVVQAARVAIQRGSSRMQIRLEPPELGTLRVDVRHSSEGLHLQLQASNPRAQQLLQQNSSQLRAALEASGFQANRIEIDVRVNVRQEDASQRQSDPQSQNSPQQHPGQQSNSQSRQHADNPNFTSGQSPATWQEDFNQVEFDSSKLVTAAPGQASGFQELNFAKVDVRG